MSRRNKRLLIGVPIVAFWLTMMGLLLKSELGVERLAADVHGQQRLRSATDSWLGISLAEGPRVGHIHLRQTPEERHGAAGARMNLEARMSLELMGKSTDLDLSGSVWSAYESQRIDFDFAVRSAGHDFSVAGKVADGELHGKMISAGETLPFDLPVAESLSFAGGLGSMLRFPALEVGDVVRLDSFDPMTLSKSQARVRCTARETLRFGGGAIETRRLTVTTNGLSSLAWIDDAGEVVRAETPIGLVLERITPGEARLAPRQHGEVAGLLNRIAIRPTGQRPFRSARAMTVQLGGLDDLTLPEDGVQTSLGSGRYRVDPKGRQNRVDPEGRQRNRGRMPAGPATAGAPALDRYLSADAFVQSDHSKIRLRADAITGAETDPWHRSVAIHDWVFSNLDKEAVISIPSALEVLEQRRGDCNEHTVLFTALARAAGLPTRIAIGIVWSDDLEGFYYHAWPEVHLGDWTWMDPTLGQPVADATHIKLLNGGIESWPRLLPYLGKLEVEVLDVE